LSNTDNITVSRIEPFASLKVKNSNYKSSFFNIAGRNIRSSAAVKVSFEGGSSLAGKSNFWTYFWIILLILAIAGIAWSIS